MRARAISLLTLLLLFAGCGGTTTSSYFPSRHEAKARRLIQRKEYAKAVDEARLAVDYEEKRKAAPQQIADAHVLLGNAYYDANRRVEALQHLRLAAATGHLDAESTKRLCLLQEEQDRWFKRGRFRPMPTPSPARPGQ